MRARPETHAPEAVRAELDRVLGSESFEASERNRRFLSFVVEETLAGRAERIKAYAIATDVFGRDESFDPQADPIVRIEAGRLRRALERYYLTAGSGNPIRITVPKGSYVPVFTSPVPSPPDGGTGDADERRQAVAGSARATRSPDRLKQGGLALAGFAMLALAALLGSFLPLFEPATSGADGRHGPAIFVAPFEREGDFSTFPSFARGFTREVIVELTRFNDLFVFGPETTFSQAENGDLQRLVDEHGVDFVLSGGMTVAGDRFTVSALLSEARSGHYLWAERFDGQLGAEGILRARDEIAARVARALAQPYGVIFENRARENAGKPPGLLGSYDCVTRFYIYWRTFRREEFRSVRACLEQAIVADPDYAEAFAALSLVSSDAYRFGFGDGVAAGDPRDRAVELAERAIALAPDGARGYHALALAYWLKNDVEGNLGALRKGLALNPNDTELMAELGMRLAWRNRWDEGLPLLRDAFARNPAQPSGYRLPLFLDHYRNGRYREALAEAQTVETPHLLYGHAAVAMASARLGLTREAEAAVNRILAIVPDYGDRVVADLEMRNLHPDLIDIVVDGLRDAGLPAPERPSRERS